MTGKGPKTETWQRKIGLKNGWEGTERFSQLRVEVDESGVGGDLGLSGDYTLHPKCGTAQASLHSCEANGRHLFLGCNSIAKRNHSINFRQSFWVNIVAVFAVHFLMQFIHLFGLIGGPTQLSRSSQHSQLHNI